MKKELKGRVSMLGFDKIDHGIGVEPPIPGRRSVGIALPGGEMTFNDWQGPVPKYESWVTVTIEYEEH